MNDQFYTETAFNPGKWEKLSSPRDIKSYSSTEQERRKFFLPKGIYIDESLARTPIEMIDLLKNEEELKESIGDGEWYEFGWVTERNPHEMWNAWRLVLRFIFILAIISTVITYGYKPSYYFEDLSWIWLFVVFGGLYLFAAYKTKTSEDKNNIGFNRKTGMVSIPRKGQEPFVAPFHEFIPYFYPHHILHGVNYHLYLGHRNEEIGAVNPNAGKHEQEMYVDWALIQRFMDVSKPLPDIPLFEPFRQLDPTTKAYDKMTGRPEHYWRDMDIKDGQRLQRESYKRVRSFPASDQSQWREVPLEYTQWPSIGKS